MAINIKSFFGRLKGMIKKNLMKNVSELVANTSDSTDKMMTAIDMWLNLYGDNAPWLGSDDTSLGIPAMIASEFARSVTLEMEIDIHGVDKNASEMADFIDEQFAEIRKKLRMNTEYACAGGGIVFKPYVNNGKITTEIIQANEFLPVAFDSADNITAAYFIYRHWDKQKIYTRLEKHELTNKQYTITNKCYVSSFEESIGKECALTNVDDWAGIQPTVVLEDVEKPLFSYFKIPLGNTIDMNSPLGVSVYARAIGLIKEADTQFGRLIWEYSGGELAIDASEDSFRTVNGEPQLPEGKERLFRTNSLDTANANGVELFKAWAPTLRDANYTNGLNELLMRIEDVVHLSRGSISNPAAEARTATEIKILKQRAYSTVTDIQKSLESSLDNLAYAMYALAILYELCPDGDYEISYIWDDSIIVDAETERVRDQQEVRDGLMQKYEYRMKWYGEDEETARMMVGQEEDESDDDIMGFDDLLSDDDDDLTDDGTGSADADMQGEILDMLGGLLEDL